MSMMLPVGLNLNASYSPPRRGGEAAPSRKCREATKSAQTPLLCEEGNVLPRKRCPKKLKVAALLHKDVSIISALFVAIPAYTQHRRPLKSRFPNNCFIMPLESKRKLRCRDC